MMKNFLVFLLTLQTSIFCLAQSQITDDFTDGNTTESPIWLGETLNFVVNPDALLQLAAPAIAGQSHLSTSSEIINEAEWSFYVKLAFNPSSSNYMDIYLVSDEDNLKNPLNGYFVRIGNTQDEVSLYRQSGASSTSIKIIDGADQRVDFSIVECNIKVTKTNENFWELFVDTDLNGNYISEGTTMDNEHFFSKYFGILCTYTSTRSDKFFFDKLFISGKPFLDETAPTFDTLLVTSDSTIQVIFSEKINLSSANTANYLVDKSIGNPYSTIQENDSIVILSFQNKFENQVAYLLNIHGIEDPFSNVMENLSIPFTYLAPYTITFNDVLITEIMADPNPGVDLPEYEYLEIFNPSQETYTINKMTLVVGGDTVTLSDFSMLPEEYMILCQSSAVEHLEKYGKTLSVTNWPSLNNTGEAIVLFNSMEKLVFSMEYNDSWYKTIEKNDGGWSLEMIDTDFPCKGSENWMASGDPSGGTPGRKNASSDELSDFSGPLITRIIAESDTSVIVYLNEKIRPKEITIQQISTNPPLDVELIQLHLPEYSTVTIGFSTTISPKTTYELTIKNLYDCIGNIQQESSSTFVLPEKADSLDLIINEILFNPWPDGVDFVELYNQSDKYIDLQSLRIGNNDDISPISDDHFIIEPEQYLALTENPELLNNNYPGIPPENIIEVHDMPGYNDDEGAVTIMTGNGNNIDFFQYNDAHHASFLKDTEGVSLERITWEGPSDNPNNWHSAASTSGFATPGKMNSQFMISGGDESEVTIDPQVFAPGQSGYHEFTTIKCRFQNSGNMANILILDAHGRVIKTIISHLSIGAEEDFKWEGQDDAGQQVRMGPYIVFLEIYNTEGFKKLYRKKVVVGAR